MASNFTRVFLDVAHSEPMFFVDKCCIHLMCSLKSFKVGKFLGLQILVFILVPCFGFPFQRFLLSIYQNVLSYFQHLALPLKWFYLCFFCNLNFFLFTHSISIRVALLWSLVFTDEWFFLFVYFYFLSEFS